MFLDNIQLYGLIIIILLIGLISINVEGCIVGKTPNSTSMPNG